LCDGESNCNYIYNVIDYDYIASGNGYIDYDYLKTCNQLQTIAITDYPNLH